MILDVATIILVITVAEGVFIKEVDPPATEGPKPEDQTEIIVNDSPTKIILNYPAAPKRLRSDNFFAKWKREARNPEFTPSGKKLWEGDMILSKEQLEGIFGREGTRKAIDDLTKRWPNGVIPYRFLPVSEPDRDVILSGLHHWMDNSCLEFYEVDDDADFPHLYFNKSDGCYSSVGMMDDDGQEVSIGEDCEFMTTVAHEVGHAIGFYHEQSRPDRDQYVRILKKNILKSDLFNFDLQNDVDTYGVEYDLSSLMHYGLYDFSSNGKKTMVPLDPSKEFVIGQDEKLSFKDLKLANIMYKCSDRCKNKPDCKNGGFVTHKCTCKCPPEFIGRKCETPAPPPKNACGGKITSPTTITSPNYPENYPKGSKCIWVIQSPKGKTINLRFGDFDLIERQSKTNQCTWDYLDFRVEDDYEGFEYCGDDLIDTDIFLPFNKVVVIFKSEYNWNTGFSLNIEFQEPQNSTIEI